MASGNKTQSILFVPRAYLESMTLMPGYKWFKPLLALILFGIFYVVFVTAVVMAQELLSHDVLGFNGIAVSVTSGDNYLVEDLSDPLQVFFVALKVAIMLPAAALAAKITGVGSLGSLSSAENRLRWGRMAKLALPIIGVTAVFTIIVPLSIMVIDGNMEELGSAKFAPAGLIAILLFIPFQCAGEEYFFRGLVQKAFGSWIPVPVVVVLLQSLVFASMHGYDLLGNFSIMITGIAWGWLAVKTGGLEATIVLHSANNVTAMALSTVFVSATVTKTTTVGSFFLDVTSTLVTAAFAYYLCKRLGYLEEK